jgi:hypothetical protein
MHGSNASSALSKPRPDDSSHLTINFNGQVLLYSSPYNSIIGRGRSATVRKLSYVEQGFSLRAEDKSHRFDLSNQVAFGNYVLKFFDYCLETLTYTLTAKDIVDIFKSAAKVKNVTVARLKVSYLTQGLIEKCQRYLGVLWKIVCDEVRHLANANQQCADRMIPLINSLAISDKCIDMRTNTISVVVQPIVALLMPFFPGIRLDNFNFSRAAGFVEKISVAQFLSLAVVILMSVRQMAKNGSRHGDISDENILVEEPQGDASAIYQTWLIDAGSSSKLGGMLTVGYCPPGRSHSNWSPDRLSSNLDDRGNLVPEQEYHDGYAVAEMYLAIIRDSVRVDSHVQSAFLSSLQNQLMWFKANAYHLLTFDCLDRMLAETSSSFFSLPQHTVGDGVGAYSMTLGHA